MLKNFIIQIILDQFGHKPTTGQQKLIELLANFIQSPEQDEIFLLKGFAGTGKTSLVSAMVKAFHNFQLNPVLLAPTGRAAKVLSSYTKYPAYTIHKKIYRQKSRSDGFGEFVLDYNPHDHTIFIIDEASMISNSDNSASVFGSGRLLDDLIEYVFNKKNCKLILIGDTAQLPPVKIKISPALDKKQLESYGKVVYEFTLKEVVRQATNSGILVNATALRKKIFEEKTHTSYPRFTLSDFEDVKRVYGEDLIEIISDSYDKHSMQETMIITRSNKRANQYNQGLRHSILWREEEISTGDYIMVVKNNYFWCEDIKEIDFIANGDIAEITRIGKYTDRYGFRFAEVSLRFIDYNDIEIDTTIMLDTLNIETASLEGEKLRELFFTIEADFQDIKSKRKRYQKIKEHPYFNALQVKFAYAVTCHKAQGGQWKSIFVDQGYIIDEMLNVEYLRWLYTALTRATENLYLVNFKDEFFNKKDLM